ncbi:neprilysin-1-like [Cylas formicarius]|uniref:neprilysin-1-like n=1 Tax=Cylas formicarius TaxID=197179 RepID=UPI0029589002|nr:neprilysin-1-like [Cylas formicarius]
MPRKMLRLFCCVLVCVSAISGCDSGDYECQFDPDRPESEGPCDNFYRHTCSAWLSQTRRPEFESVWNHFIEGSYKINRNVRKILENASDDVTLKKAKTFYEACVNFGSHEDRYVINLKLLIDYFSGWPLAEDKWSGVNYNWLESVAQINKVLDVHPIFKFHVGIDYKDTRKYSIYIEPGTLIFPQNALLKPLNYSRELRAYSQWIIKSALHLYPKKYVTKRLKLQAKNIVEFEARLAKFMVPKSNIEKTNVKMLSVRTSINFLDVLRHLFAGPTFKVEQTDSVVVRHLEYFVNVMEFLKDVDSESIANYLIWCVIKALSRDTSRYLHELNFLMDKAVLGITADISRRTECVSKVIDHFSFAILAKYLDFYFDESSIENVDNIVTNARMEFEKLLDQNDWISEGTRSLAIEKVKKMQHFVGFPNWARNGSVVNMFYENLSISNNHLLNVINVKNFKSENNLRLLNSNADSILWPSNIFEVNSYYSVLQNSVFIPLGILQPPFYKQNRPSIHNYGALGALIGHELSHSLDTIGRQANVQGTISQWWPLQDIFNYQTRTRCFEDLYNSKHIPTVGENIADNVGLEISLQAYKNLDLEGILLTDMGMDGLFFSSYAFMWCEKSEAMELFNDEHTAVESRVNRAMLNNKSFRKLFNCSSVPNYCELW